MPEIPTRNKTVYLSVADLDLVTTWSLLTQKGALATEGIRNVGQEFTRGSKDGTLNETSLSTEGNGSLGFLGKIGTRPFFMVHAGINFLVLTTKENSPINNKPIGVPNDLCKSHALCLTVSLSNPSFVLLEGKGREPVISRWTFTSTARFATLISSLRASTTKNMPRPCKSYVLPIVESGVLSRNLGSSFLPVRIPTEVLKKYLKDEAAYASLQQRWKDISKCPYD